VRLPCGDVAYRINLLSAVAAAATLLLLYLAARQAGLQRQGATMAIVAISVGHTFWMHAVRAEVYTVFTFFVALHLWLWARWILRAPKQAAKASGNAPLLAGAALSGITLLAHQMGLLLVPTWAFLFWSQRHRLRAEDLARALMALFLGLVPFLVVIHYQIAAVSGVELVEAIWRYFTHFGVDFSSSFFDFSLTMLPRDFLMWALFTGLQFAGGAIVLIILGLRDRLRKEEGSIFWPALFLLYVTTTVFAFSYRVNDRYVFMLPGYLALALFAGAGWQAAGRLCDKRASCAGLRGRLARIDRRKLYAACLTLLIAMPVSLYAVAPRVMAAQNLNPLNVRSLPGRDPYFFFLWPGKQGHLGARLYGESTLHALPSEAILIADHTPIETLRFLQEVEGLRRDVRLIQIEPGDSLAPLLDSLPDNAAIFIADNNPDYYDLGSIPQANLIAMGPVFKLAFSPN
jgi:hypothetical protein